MTPAGALEGGCVMNDDGDQPGCAFRSPSLSAPDRPFRKVDVSVVTENGQMSLRTRVTFLPFLLKVGEPTVAINACVSSSFNLDILTQSVDVMTMMVAYKGDIFSG
jgi:hypothetical protein